MDNASIFVFAMLVYPGMGWKSQLLVFSVLSVATIVAFRVYQRKHPARTDQPELNRRSRQYIGRSFRLGEPIVNGMASLHVDDSTWRIVGDDMPAGETITVVGVDGVLLKVEKKA